MHGQPRPASGVTDPCGSSGASKHGTLANWATRLQAATGKTPVLVDGGYSLAGAAGDGVLAQITYGPNKYVFTNVAKSKVTVTADGEARQDPQGQQGQVQRQGRPGRHRRQGHPRGQEEGQVERR